MAEIEKLKQGFLITCDCGTQHTVKRNADKEIVLTSKYSKKKEKENENENSQRSETENTNTGKTEGSETENTNTGKKDIFDELFD